MCGHVGVAGDLNSYSTRAFKDMLYFDAVRGMHGTGIASVPFHGERTIDRLKIHKTPFPAYIALENNSFCNAAEDMNAAVLIGHNRHATIGEHNYENTHPFTHGSVVGAHNGTVSPSNRDLDVEGKFGTDSDKIIASIAAHGIEDTVGNMTTCHQGAWALVWYDFADNTLNFVRNEHRPLYYAFNAEEGKEREQIFWSSEVGIMMAACERRGIKLSKIYSVPEDTHLCWAVPASNQIFGKVVRAKCAGKKKVIPSPPHYSHYIPTSSRSGKVTSWKNGRRVVRNEGDLKLPASFNTRLEGYGKFNTSNIIDLFRSNCDCIWCHKKIPPQHFKEGKAIVVALESAVCGTCRDRPLIAEAVAHRKTSEKSAIIIN